MNVEYVSAECIGSHYHTQPTIHKKRVISYLPFTYFIITLTEHAPNLFLRQLTTPATLTNPSRLVIIWHCDSPHKGERHPPLYEDASPA